MKIRNINEILHHNGTTNDIIDSVMYAYEIEKDPQIRVLAYELKGNDVLQTCKNIFNFLVENIRYKSDASGRNGELIRTPARLIYDKIGDCKSYSLFTAVILRHLGIEHHFRFVSYNKFKKATHVYVVANNNIVIDAVAAVQLRYPFNHEVKYTYRVDMKERGTKISYLAGLPENNIGAFTPMSDALRKAGMYFIYLFIPDSDLKYYPEAVTRKKRVQRNLFNIIHRVHIFASKDKVISLFREGIKKQTGLSPEDYLKRLRSSNSQVSEPISTATIIAIVNVIIVLIKTISAIFPKSKVEEFNYKDGVADLQNEMYMPGNIDIKDKSGVSIYAGIGIIGLLMLIRKK